MCPFNLWCSYGPLEILLTGTSSSGGAPLSHDGQFLTRENNPPKRIRKWWRIDHSWNHGKLEFHGKRDFVRRPPEAASTIMRPGGKAWTPTRGKGEAKGCCSFRDSALGRGEGWWGSIAVMRALNICGKPKANIEEPQVLLKAYAANTMFKTRNFNEFQWSPSICSRLSPTPHLKIRFYHILKRATQLRTLICTSCASPKLNQPSRWSPEKTCYRKEPSSPQRKWCFWEDDALTIYPVPQHYDATNFWKSEWTSSWIFPTQSKVASFPCHWNQWS